MSSQKQNLHGKGIIFREFYESLILADVSPSTRVEILDILPDPPQLEEISKVLLKATAHCETDEEYLQTVKEILNQTEQG